MTYSSRRRSLLLAGTLGMLLVAPWPATAQQPLPPGSPLIGRPDTPGAQKLAPVPSPPLAADADKLPLDTDNDLIVINDSITPAVGTIAHFSGKVLDAKGAPVRNALVEI